MDENEVAEYVELIDELQKEGMGNSNTLIEIKQILVKDKGLDENNLQYLTKLDVQLDGKIKENISLKNRFSCDICGTVVSGRCSNCHKDYDVKKNVTKKSYSAWYVVSILLGFSGALIAWASLRNENNYVATNCLILGLLVSIALIMIVAVFYIGN